MLERAGVITVAFLLDMLLGDPQFMWHPVRAIGKLIEYTEKLLYRLLRIKTGREEDRTKKIISGVVLVLVVTLVSVAVPGVILFAAGRVNRYFKLGVEAVMCYQLLAMKSLKDESMKVYKALRYNGMDDARQAVSMIVGRDTESLDENGVTKAAVETVAENTSDGVVAPLMFMLVFGALGGYFYKAVNTMDSMVGYRNDKYVYFGRAAARMDDVLNFIPSRVAAVCMILAAGFLPGMNMGNAIRIFRRDRYKHKSPNSAQTEAVCAGALGVLLAGNAYYFGTLYEKPTIGDATREIEIEDIKRANRLLYLTSIIALVFGIAIILVLSML